MAPAALVLFLFFFAGWLGSFLLRNRELSRDAPLFRPLGLFAALVILSGLITFWRYANFAPFLSDRIYELVTNAHGVSAGGAIMSVVFYSLNYLTGIAFLFIAYNTFRAEKDFGPVLAAVLIGVYVSVSFGLFQYLGHLSLGNNPISITHRPCERHAQGRPLLRNLPGHGHTAPHRGSSWPAGGPSGSWPSRSSRPPPSFSCSRDRRAAC